MKGLHAIVHGRVQGVFFRDTTRKIAQTLGLTGTVRNLPDGTVEIFAEGDQAQFDQLFEQLYQEYPSHITSIDQQLSDELKGYASFDVIHSYSG